MRSGAYRAAEKRRHDEHGAHDQKKGEDIREGADGEPGWKVGRERGIHPAGEDETGDETKESGELADRTPKKRLDRRPKQKSNDQPVKAGKAGPECRHRV